jgi:hypothetical protein
MPALVFRTIGWIAFLSPLLIIIGS